MSRKYPKKFRKEQARKLKAAEAFVEAWATSELASNLITDYDCQIGCEEANTFADLLRSFRYVITADQILADHGEYCEYPHAHDFRGVYTFSFDSRLIESDGWTIVANGKDGLDAESKARDFLADRLREAHGKFFGPWTDINLIDVESGVPGSTALYSWTDIREVSA
ncbi:hypothetical protein [Streptomyces sp. NPDC014622]|uniref:hypothetical protein n=1 Tax=Streptomyces sp. NPDC014622 TaxID=3364874 RepID=UPI0036FE063F